MKTKEELTAEINKLKIEYADYMLDVTLLYDEEQEKIKELEKQLADIDRFKLRKGDQFYRVDNYCVHSHYYNQPGIQNLGEVVDIISSGLCWIDQADAKTYAKYAKVLNDAVNKERVELNVKAFCIQANVNSNKWVVCNLSQIRSQEYFLPFFGTLDNIGDALEEIGQDGAQALHDVIGRALKVSEVEV